MQQFVTIAELAKRHGMRISEIQECARRAGVSAQSGAAKLYPAQVEKVVAQIAAKRREDQWRHQLRGEGVRVELASHEAPPKAVYRAFKHIECACCRITISNEPEPERGPAFCPFCVNHFEVPTESIQRTLARLRDHDERMRNGFVSARAMVNQFREQVQNLYRRLDDWRAAAVKIVLDHQDNTDDKGHCKLCGGSSCRALRILGEVNPGFLRRVEVLACFDDDELERHLHPRRKRDTEYLADDDETG
jgi:hypothetical protein